MLKHVVNNDILPYLLREGRLILTGKYLAVWKIICIFASDLINWTESTCNKMKKALLIVLLALMANMPMMAQSELKFGYLSYKIFIAQADRQQKERLLVGRPLGPSFPIRTSFL